MLHRLHSLFGWPGVVVGIAVLWLLWEHYIAHAAGAVPAVNADMGCTTSGQTLSYNGSAIGCSAPTRPSATVSTLPTCNAGATGQMYFVTDALVPVAIATVAGGGAVKIGVTCNGTNWIVE